MGGGPVTVLLDTHTFLWWLAGDEQLSQGARDAITEPTSSVLVSAASAWEICTKVRIGKLPGAVAVANDVMACVRSQQFTDLAITVEHAQRAGALPGHHRDPFDRMLIAQALALDVPIVSNEVLFESYGVRRIW